MISSFLPRQGLRETRPIQISVRPPIFQPPANGGERLLTKGALLAQSLICLEGAFAFFPSFDVFSYEV